MPCIARNAIRHLKLPVANGIAHVAIADTTPSSGKMMRIPNRVTNATTGNVDTSVLTATVDVSIVVCFVVNSTDSSMFVVELLSFVCMHMTAKLNAKIFDHIDVRHMSSNSIIANRVRVPKMQSIDDDCIDSFVCFVDSI